jgi:hypothetical protein
MTVAQMLRNHVTSGARHAAVRTAVRSTCCVAAGASRA